MSEYYEKMKHRAKEIYDEGFKLFPERGAASYRTRFHKDALARIDQPDRGIIKQYLDNLKVRNRNTGNSDWNRHYAGN
jgi:hypothetical protein